MKTKKKLGLRTFLAMFFRSFFIQAVWNYQSMISIGFCFALVPVAKKLFKTKEGRSAFVNRHLNFFNAHPYFSSFALGAIARVEEQIMETQTDDYSQVTRLKNALIGPLGAIGDQLIWATLKPASILIGLLAVILIDRFETKLICLIVLLVMYNIPHLYIRMFGLLKGYEAGFEIYKKLKIENFKTVRDIYGSLGSLALATIFSFSFFQSSSEGFNFTVVFVICFLSAYFYKKLKQSVYRSLTFPVIIAVLLGLLIESL
jgi:mannose/fructose/N-acetylgalactosamine-specific phosphotransferase system component IID